MDPSFLTNDRFDRSDYSRNEINLFASDFAGRLENLPNPVLSPDDRALVRSLLTAFQSALGVQATTIGQQVGGTLTRQQAGDAARAFISQQEGLVRAKFGKASAPYLEFYPQGISEYQRATVEGLRALLERYATAATNHSQQLGESFKSEVLALKQQYNAARDSQTTALYGSANLWDDGLIDPRDTRTLLGFLLDICHEAEVRPLQPNTFGVARF